MRQEQHVLPVVSSGGGTRTPDTRIMIPQSNRRNSKSVKSKENISDRLSLHLPYEPSPDLASVIDAWSTLPEPIRADPGRAGILAMVKASGNGRSR